MLGILICLAWSVPAWALEVRVRGESHLEVEAQAAGTNLTVAGRLVDDRGQGVPLATLEMEVDHAEGRSTHRAETDYDGVFVRSFGLAPGAAAVRVRYPGGAHLVGSDGQASAELEVVPADLEVSGPGWVHGEREPVPVRIRATAAGQGLATAATITVDDRPVETVMLDPRGMATVDVGPYLRGGPQEVNVDLARTAYRPGLSETLTVQRVGELRVHGQVDRVVRRMAQGMEVVVGLNDGTEGVGEADLSLYLYPLDEEESETLERRVRTDERGRAAEFFSERELQGLRWQVVVEVVPPAGEPVLWEGEEVYYVASLFSRMIPWLGLLGILLGAGWVGRRRVWAFLERVGRALRSGEEGEEEAEVPRFEAVERVSYQGLPRTFRDEREEAPTASVVQVWDPWAERPVVGARLRVEPTAGGEGCQRETDVRGIADLGVAAREAGELLVEAAGYVPVRAALPFPGSRKAVRVEVTAVPLKIREMYRWTLRRAAGRDFWGRLTPREIEVALAGLSQSLGGPEEMPQVDRRRWVEAGDEDRQKMLLAAITAVVEETNFSGELYDRQWWERARGLMEELLRGLEGRPQGDP